ncbi:transporter [Thalassomonas viridans]|uniref:Transporter n=1 Tax=Thalassomonas viridans TaxID=137584 RepID=A0AAF0CE99_9GAMM|nr:transporter [Thalassomonas viridans]
MGCSLFCLKQLSRHKQDGVELAGSKERVFAIGPGLRYHHQGFTLRANAYLESAALNRPEGHRFFQ